MNRKLPINRRQCAACASQTNAEWLDNENIRKLQAAGAAPTPEKLDL